MQFLTSPEDERQDFCVLRGTLPPGATVPLHSHPDTEAFFVLAGTVEVLRENEHGCMWSQAVAGDYVQISTEARHAWRNTSGEPAVQLLVTTNKLGRFFLEVGRPTSRASQAPTSAELTHLAAVSARYGYWNATPEENAAVGITLRF